MSEFRNNSFANDTQADHTQRVIECEAGITKYSADLMFRDAVKVGIPLHRERWLQVIQLHTDKWGDELQASALIRQLEAALLNEINSARKMVEAILLEEAVKDVIAFNLRKDFGIDKPIPHSLSGRIDMARQIVAANRRLIESGSPFALPAAISDKIALKITEIETAIQNRSFIQNERLTAGLAKTSERERGDDLLTQAYNWVVACWSDEDMRLLEFGFVPRSMIWTSHDDQVPETPKNFIYDAANFMLAWDAGEHCTAYCVERKGENDEKFVVVANVKGLKWRLNDPYIGITYFRLVPMNGDIAGDATLPLRVGIGALPNIANFRYELADHTLRWDAVPGATVYLLLENGVDLGELFYATTVPFNQLPGEQQYVRVWGTDGYRSTHLSDIVVVPPLE